MVIDDGLHSPIENLRVLALGLPRIRPGGWVVIEDIGREKIPLWELAGRIIPSDEFEPWLIDTRSRVLFAVRRLH
jgi:hypothetical protein